MSIQQTNAAENEELTKNAPTASFEEAVSVDPVEKTDGESERQNSADDNTGNIQDDDGLAEWLESVDPDNILADSASSPGDKTENSQDDASSESSASLGSGASLGSDQNTELESKLTDLTAQLDEIRDQLLRKTADFDNYRKRMNQEKQKAIEFANESLLLDIIPVIDDFERAIQSAEISEELKGLPAGKVMLDGITMIEKQLVSKLENKWGLKRFNSAGEAFNPNLHEAMLMEKAPDIEEPVVKEDFIKGYMLKDRVIRTAKVKVLMPEEEESRE